MGWTITGVVVAALATIVLAMLLRRSNRSAGAGTIAALAVGWAIIRWRWIHENWWLIRPLGGWWVLGLTVSLVLIVLLAIWFIPRPWLGWIALAVSVLAPFGDLFWDVWHWQPVLWVLFGVCALVALILARPGVWLLAAMLLVAALFVTVLSGMSQDKPLGATGTQSQAPTTATTSVSTTSSATGTSSSSRSTTSSPQTLSSPAVTTSATPTPSPSTTSAAPSTTPQETCPAAYVQKFDPNQGYKFYSEGVKDATQDIAYLGHDARTLAFRAYAMKLANTPDPAGLLTTDGKCLSRKGQDTFLMVKGALTAKGTIVDNNAQAPANATNSGMVNGKPVVSETPGIRGDRSAISYTLPDGTKVIVMKRCGNLVFSETPPKDIPKGPTDNPKPVIKTQSSPSTSSSSTPPAPTTSSTVPTTPSTSLAPKNPAKGAASQSHVPTQVQGSNPPVLTTKAAPPKVQSPAPSSTYKAPAPPEATSAPAKTTPRSTPPSPPATGAPATSAPATGCVPPPGMTTC